MIGFGLKIYNYKESQAVYIWEKLWKCLLIGGIGIYFFIKGLNEYDDYLRFNHGMWHLCAGISSLYGFQSLKYK